MGARAPRVCGDDPGGTGIAQGADNVLPAYAGMILTLGVVPLGVGRAPRVCGDDPYRIGLSGGASQCSPRMRG